MRGTLLAISMALGASCGGRVDPSGRPAEVPADSGGPSVPATRIVQLVIQGGGTCVVRGDGTVWCWGYNDRDRLGVGDACAERCTTPTQVLGFRDVVQVTGGGRPQCAVLRDGSVVCRGRCRLVGKDVSDCHAATAASRPTVIAGLRNVAEVQLGDDFDCVRYVDGTVECAQEIERSPLHPKLGGRATSIAVGKNHACAVVEDGGLWCWGANFDGELGQPPTAYAPNAVRVVGVHDVDAVATGVALTCAHERDGTVWCFGLDDWRPRTEAGRSACSACDGARCVYEPVRVADVLADAQLAIAGTSMFRGAFCSSSNSNTTCVLGRDTSPWCWGPMVTSSSATPHAIAIDNVVRIATGPSHACVVRTDGTLWCWGANYFGELGDGTTIDRPLPVQVNIPWTPTP